MSGELPNADPVEEVVTLSPPTPQETIMEVLQRDILGAEFLMALFWSAMNSFRHDSILRPFPAMYLEHEDVVETGERPERSEREEQKKDIEGLRQVFGSLPPLERISKGKATLSTQQADLLQWILNPKRFTVSSKEPSFFSCLLEKWDSKSGEKLPRKPDYIFELEYNEESESKFRSITGEHGIMYAFHGSSVDNFYSIVHNGLLNIFNKVSAFGEGTYLSTELGVCLNWSPCGAFQRSGSGSLPQAASCVAMCEVVKHPSVTSRQQIGGEPNLQGKVPDKYFIVSNDEFIRIKYIFVFETQKPVVRSRGWLYEHKYMVVLLLYLVFLFAVGASQSRFLKRFFKKYYNYYWN